VRLPQSREQRYIKATNSNKHNTHTYLNEVKFITDTIMIICVLKSNCFSVNIGKQELN